MPSVQNPLPAVAPMMAPAAVQARIRPSIVAPSAAQVQVSAPAGLAGANLYPAQLRPMPPAQLQFFLSQIQRRRR
jgi:hypothetical protein